MARFSGRNVGLWTAGGLGLVTVGPLAVFSPTAAALTMATGGLVGLGVAQLRLSRLKARCDKLSQEVDILSQRLIKAEGSGSARGQMEPNGAVQAEVQELTVEIGLLSGIVRDLSAVIRNQDDEIAALKARPVPIVQPPSEPKSTPAPPPVMVATDPVPVVVAAPVMPARRIEPFRPAPIPQRLEEPPAPEPAAAPPPPRRPIPPRPVAPPPQPDETAILAAFDAGHLDVYLQPVVTLPQRKVVAYEAQARLRVADEALDAQQYLPVLERHGRTTELDRRMLARAGTIVGHLNRRGSDARVTYGLSPLSLFEPGFLKEIARMAGADQALSGLDIALPQASWRGLDSGQLGLLGALRGHVGFALDRPTDLRFDAHEMAGLGIGQVRVPAGLLLRPVPSRGAVSDIAVEDLAPALARARIRLTVVEITAEADVPDLIELNVPFAQGAAFAPARPVRGEILAALPSEAPPPPEDDPGPERRSFRSLLRRAG